MASNVTSFRKGQSGNPSGRPKALIHVQELARAHTEAAIDTLAAIMSDEKASPTARIAAANALLDRGYGKPTSIVETHIDNRNVREWTTEELDAFLNEALLKEALEQN
jgi:hypothetical protein